MEQGARWPQHYQLFLAKSFNVKFSFENAHKYVNNAIKTSPKFGRGNGPINHCYNINEFTV